MENSIEITVKLARQRAALYGGMRQIAPAAILLDQCADLIENFVTVLARPDTKDKMDAREAETVEQCAKAVEQITWLAKSMRTGVAATIRALTPAHIADATEGDTAARDEGMVRNQIAQLFEEEVRAYRSAQDGATSERDKLYRMGQKDALILFAQVVDEALAASTPAARGNES